MYGGAVFNSTNYQLENLVSEIDSGIIALPELQRPFVWKDKQIRDLFDSLYRGLPTGLLILWKIGSGNEFKPIGLNKSTTPNRLVIDGQQRLTSLFSIIKNKKVYDSNFKLRKAKIAFNPLTESFEVANSSIRKNPEWIDDISEVYAGRLSKIKNNYFKNLKESRNDLPIDEEKIEDNIDKLNEIKYYSFSVLELSQELDPEEVSEIFVRINSKGKVLNQSDFILTIMSVYWDSGRKELEEFAKNAKIPSNEVSPFNLINARPSPENLLRTIVGYSFLRGQLKYAFLILKGRDLENKVTEESIRIKNFEILRRGQAVALNLKNWHDFINIIQSIGFVNYDLISSKFAFYATYSLYLLGRYEFNVEKHKLNQIISKWFVFSLLTQRYTSSPESVFEQDLAKFREKNIFIEPLEEEMSIKLTDDYWNITLPERLISSRTNHIGNVYTAAKCFEDINVIFSKISLKDNLSPLIKSSKKSIDKHHIFPKNYLKKLGYDQVMFNQQANLIYIEYKDNISISDKKPSEYWNVMVKKLNDVEMEYLEQNYVNRWDLPIEFWNLDYEEFLYERRKLMASAIKNYFYKL